LRIKRRQLSSFGHYKYGLAVVSDSTGIARDGTGTGTWPVRQPGLPTATHSTQPAAEPRGMASHGLVLVISGSTDMVQIPSAPKVMVGRLFIGSILGKGLCTTGLRLWKCRTAANMVTLRASLFLGCLLQSADVRIGYGINITDLTPSQQVTSRIVSQIAGFFLILAALWSKVSFAVTLLRISDGWIKGTVWCVIISVNLVLGGSVAMQWFWCWPSARIWNRDISGTCLPRNVVNGYNMAAAGRWFGSVCPGSLAQTFRLIT